MPKSAHASFNVEFINGMKLNPQFRDNPLLSLRESQWFRQFIWKKNKSF